MNRKHRSGNSNATWRRVTLSRLFQEPDEPVPSRKTLVSAVHPHVVGNAGFPAGKSRGLLTSRFTRQECLSTCRQEALRNDRQLMDALWSQGFPDLQLTRMP